MQIVYARAEKTKLVQTGRSIVRDMNLFPEFRLDWEGRAGMWRNKGTEDDLRKAREWAPGEGYTIFAYPANEPDPLGRAKCEVVEAARQQEPHQ